MARETYDDADILELLSGTRTIAVVGASPDPSRHSHRVLRYMKQAGFRMLPINPLAAGQEIAGEPVLASLADMPAPVDLVNVFRRQDAIPSVVADVLASATPKRIRALWLQLDLYDEDAARRAREAGLEVVMDRCLKVEYGRLLAHSA